MFLVKAIRSCSYKHEEVKYHALLGFHCLGWGWGELFLGPFWTTRISPHELVFALFKNICGGKVLLSWEERAGEMGATNKLGGGEKLPCWCACP